MKPTVKQFVSTSLLMMAMLVLSSFSIGDKKDKDGELSIRDASTKLEKAIESRKFADAKEVINEVLPWMKQDIKTDKKTLSQIGKSIDESELDKKSFSTKLTKKNKIYESTKHLVETSPAAIRVKGKDLVKLVNEYASLIE